MRLHGSYWIADCAPRSGDLAVAASWQTQGELLVRAYGREKPLLRCMSPNAGEAREFRDQRGPCTMTCAFGLCETAVPIKLGSTTIGYLQTGQVLREKPTEASFQHAFQEARGFGVDLEEKAARDAYFSTSVVSRKKMDSISRLLSIFSDHLSMKSNQIAVQNANAEPPAIVKAKEFIEANHTEDISLAQVAQAVHTSVFYFCKLFKKVTGINFTEHLSRVRTEKAKNLLLNPNLRVSEIAYEVGFQSLTHFNRVFKNVVGESPSNYRSRLSPAISR